MRKNILFLAAAAAMLVGCTETEELAKNQQVESADGRIDFSVYANRTTRAGKAGALDSETLKAADAGFGVFAYYTQNTRYDKYSSTPNFMYNQFVKWDADYNGWNYYPAKYWPNEYGSNATSKDIDYLTFFAYAPYVVANPNTGIVEGSQQDKNITEVSRSAAKGDPFVRYIVDTNPQSSVDLLWGVAANEDFKGLANPDAVVKADNCFINLSKQVGASDGKIQWKFYHALAKLNVQIIAAADVAAVNGNPYAEPGTAAIPASDSTKIYLRSIDFTGFVTQGMLSLHSDEPLAEANLMPKWMNYDGTKLTVSNVTFYDGLKDGKEGYANNINAGEKPQGLNPVLLEEPTRTKWSEKKPGVPTDKYVNLFAGAENAGDAIFVIPTNEPMDITIDYDIMTSDSHLGKNLSDGVTKGSRIPNTIRHSLNNLVIEAGKSYVIKLILGVESVKVTAVEVESWTDEDPQVVELPYNPEGDGGEGGTTVTYAMAAEATTEDLGKLICTDGHIHAYGEDADCTADRVAMITYVGSQTAETAYTHGLALALQDASEDKFTWSTSMASEHTFHPYPVQTGIKTGPAESGLQYNATQNTASYPAFQAAIANNDVATPTDCSAWFLPSGYQWYQMFQALGSKNALRDSFESVGGANLKKEDYQTSTEYSGTEGVWCRFGSTVDFTSGNKTTGRCVRSCLAF